MKAYACVGTHNKIYACVSSPMKELVGRLEVYLTRKDAERVAWSPHHVVEITIIIHRRKNDTVEVPTSTRR